MSGRRPWWHPKKQPKSVPVVGERSGEKRLAVTGRDKFGDVEEETWVGREAWDQYDETRWRDEL